MVTNSDYKKLKTKLDKMWSEIIKIRADYKSEISGQTDSLDSHHIVRKPNNALRYCIDNGICLTSWEHRYGIHGQYEEDYRERIKQVRGQDIYRRLSLMRDTTVDLRLIEMQLKQEYERLKNE